MYSAPDHKIPLKKAIGYVLLSVFIIWGSLFLTWLVHKSVLDSRKQDPRYTVAALVQSCPQYETLENWQLCELLELSRDKAPNLYDFDPKVAASKLLSYPVISKATVRRLPPSIIHVDYTLKEPYVFLSDFSNIALDKERTAFPLKPFYTPKKLPELYLGVESISYNTTLETPEAHIAFRVLAFLETALPNTFRILRIDSSKACAKTFGSQEIVVVLEDSGKTRYFRLSPRLYEVAINDYLAHKATLDQINPASLTQILDLRSPNIALVK